MPPPSGAAAPGAELGVATRIWALVDNPERSAGPHAHLTPQASLTSDGTQRHGQWFTPETHRALRRTSRLAARVFPFARRGDAVEVEMHMELGFAPNACQADTAPSRRGVLPVGSCGAAPGAPAAVAGVMAELGAWGYCTEGRAWPFEPSVTIDADWGGPGLGGKTAPTRSNGEHKLHGAAIAASLGPASYRVLCGGRPSDVAAAVYDAACLSQAFSTGRTFPPTARGLGVSVIAKSKCAGTMAFGPAVARVQVALEEPLQRIGEAGTGTGSGAGAGARAHRIKAEWRVPHATNPWALVLRLEATPATGGAAPELGRVLADIAALTTASRPWDCRVSEWMFRMRSSLAVWRLEIEMTDPCPDQDAVLGAALHFGVLFEALSGSHAQDAVVCMRTHVLTPHVTELRDPATTTDWREPAMQAALREYVQAAGGKCEDDNGHVRVARSSRPKDYAQHSSLAHCSVSPKLDGSETFVVRTWGGTAAVLRDRIFFADDLRGPPLLIEGELMPPPASASDPQLLFVYDTVMAVDPALWNDPRPLPIALLPQGWRVGVTTAVCAGLGGAPVPFVGQRHGAQPDARVVGCRIQFCRKPFFASPHRPQLAVLECLRYLDRHLTPKGLHCDGLVFARMSGDYFTGEAVKVKVMPTVDIKLGPGPVPDVFEPLFRERATAISSARLRGLTRFRETDPPNRECTCMPGLVRLPVPAAEGMVAEIAPRRSGPPLLLRLRETFKPPNHVIGAMDIAFSAQHYPSPLTDAACARTAVLDPLGWAPWADAYRHGMRRLKWRLFRRFVPTGGVVVDLGAAGGDVGRLARACAPDVLHLVDISADSLERCKRRLAAQSRFAPAVAGPNGNRPPQDPQVVADPVVPVPICRVETHCESLCAENAGWAVAARGCTAVLANFVLHQALAREEDAANFAALVDAALAPTGVLVGMVHEHDALAPLWRGPVFPGLRRSVGASLAVTAELEGLFRLTVPLEAARTGRIPVWSRVCFEMGWSATAQRAEEAAAPPTALLAGFDRARWHVELVRADPHRVLGTACPPVGASVLAGSVTAFVVRRRVPLFARPLPAPVPAGQVAPVVAVPGGFRCIKVASPHDLGCAALVLAMPPGSVVVQIEWPRNGAPRLHTGRNTVPVLAPPAPVVPYVCLARWDAGSGAVVLWSVVDEAHTWEENHRACQAAFPGGACVQTTSNAARLLARYPGHWCALPAHGNAKVLFVVGADADAGVALIRPAAWAALDTWLHAALGATPPPGFVLEVITPACGTRTLTGTPVTAIHTEARHALRRYLSGIHQTGVRVEDTDTPGTWRWVWLAPPAHCQPEVATRACATAADATAAEASGSPTPTVFVMPFEPKATQEALQGMAPRVTWIVAPGSAFGISGL